VLSEGGKTLSKSEKEKRGGGWRGFRDGTDKVAVNAGRPRFVWGEKKVGNN